ncbi:unnamed protein product, partial [Larinioides sclopetarius]
MEIKCGIIIEFFFFLDLKEYDDCKSGLKLPAKELFHYLMNLQKCFVTNFNLLYEKTSISKKFEAVLCKVDMDFFNNHIEHNDKAQLFFISSFIQMMIKHKVRMM